MNNADIISELDVFASWPRAFTFSELLDFVDGNVRRKELESVLLGNSPFVRLSSGARDHDRFILDSTLFRWFCNLNVRLARAEKFRVQEKQLCHVMSHLRYQEQWHTVPEEAIQWGRSLGLVNRCHVSGEYVFPLARVLSFLSPPSSYSVADVLSDLGEQRSREMPFKKLLEDHLQKGFSQFDQKTVHIIKGRCGLLTGKLVTLGQIGATLGLTRERIRQIQTEFWTRLKSSERLRQPFLAGLLCYLIDRSGSLVITEKSLPATLGKFLAMCNGIHVAELRRFGLAILANPARLFIWLDSPKSFDMLDPDAIASSLIEKGALLISDDLRILSNAVALSYRDRLTKTQRVYLALRAIGRPAHYSRITEAYNSLFPDCSSSEHNVHAVLSRQQCGVVWIGVQGSFALREWGYVKPSKTLFETVTEIVGRIYRRTGKPVPFATIVAETGRHRKIVKQSSLVIATSCNLKLRRVGPDSFVPDSSDQRDQDEISGEQLDTILREFQKKINKNGHHD